jgi:carboxymethylenebutenolidase
MLESSPRHGEWVKVKHDSRTVDAFVVFPEVAGRTSSVIVIHEIFGLTDWVRTVADQLAAEGYIAIAPDLLSQAGPGGGNTASFENVDAARRAISELPPEQITADLNAVAEHVAGLPSANGQVAVCGFCWGGTQTFRFATNNQKIIAAFPFYGTAPTNSDELARIKSPVYGFYAENDSRVNAALDETAKKMSAAGKKFEPVTYKGAGHGFMRAGQAPDASSQNAAARKDAWKRLLNLLKTASQSDSESRPATDKLSSDNKHSTAYEFSAVDIHGDVVNLSSYRGKVLLVVNVASRCGLTGQYRELQSVFEQYRDRGLVVLGFPCNQFLNQEPGTSEEILQFCSTQYHVTFPMFAKIEVNGANSHPFYQYLTGQNLPPAGSGKITWNFEKFLIGRDGKPRARFSPRTLPNAPKVIQAIESAVSDG